MAADNVTSNAGSGGSVFRTLSDGTIEWPVSALSYPSTISAGANTMVLVDPTHGLPVAVVDTVPISAASLPLPTGAATEATLSTLNGKVTACNTGAVVVASGTITVGNATLAVTQSGTWTVASNADTAIAGTTAPSKLFLVGGKTADGTPAYDPIPLAAGGGSVVVTGTGTFAATQSGTWNIATLTSITNVVHVDDNSGSLTVDGTVTANAGTGTFAVSAASLPLPSGASTSAKQPALGTAGSASVDVLSVQGIASMIALKVDGSGVTQPVSGTFWQATQPVSGTVTANAGTGTFAVSGTVTANIGTSGSLMLDATGGKLNVAQGTALGSNTGPMIQGSVTTAAPTYTTGQVNPLSLTVAGALRVDNSAVTQPISAASLPLPSGASTEATLSTLNGKVTACNTGAVVISSGTVTTVSTVTSLTQFNGNAIATNSGNGSAGTLRVVLATDQPALTNKLLVTPDANSSVNLNQIAGTGTAVNTGTASAGTLRVVLATDQPQLTNALKVDGSAVTQPVSSAPATSGGLSISRLLAAAGANQDATIAKGSAGQVFGWLITNTNAAARFVKLYNLASGATSASTPAMTILVPGNTAGAGTNIEFSNGIAFSTGISFRITTGVADNDANAVAANEIIVNLLFK